MAGLFLVMGLQALETNGLTLKILFLIKEKGLTHISHPLKGIRKSAVYWFVLIELLGFGAVCPLLHILDDMLTRENPDVCTYPNDRSSGVPSYNPFLDTRPRISDAEILPVRRTKRFRRAHRLGLHSGVRWRRLGWYTAGDGRGVRHGGVRWQRREYYGDGEEEPGFGC